MKKVILSLVVITVIVFSSCKDKNNKETDVNKTEVSKETITSNTTFGVRGNCSMCKSTIEKAANNVEGVATAIWNVDKKKIDVSFDDNKTNAMEIHKAIAASGYDTEKVEGDLDAYKGLPGCCKYDHTMEMNIE